MDQRLYLCHGPHCSARGCAALRKRLVALLWEHRLDATVEVRESGCQDHCDHGPNLLIQPGAIRYVGLTNERLERIITAHLAGGEPVAEWLATPAMRRSSGNST